MVDVIRLGGQKQPSQFKQKLTSLLVKTAAAQAGFLGTILGGPITGIKAFFGTGLALGALEVSPKVRRFVIQKFVDPTEGGRFIGQQIEMGLTRDKLPFGERIKEGAKKAGILGAVAAGVVGAAAVGKSAIEKVRKAKVPKLPSELGLIPAVPVTGIQGQGLQPTQEPIGVAKRVPEEEKPVPVAPSIPKITNKVIVKPRINIKISKTKKFINQMNVFRSGSFHR